MNNVIKHSDKCAILLIDASIDTICKFDYMLLVAQLLPYDKFRVLFWTTPQNDNTRFKNGAYIVPFYINKANLPNIFALIKKSTTISCNSHDIVPFKYIPNTWNTNCPIYYISVCTNTNIGTNIVLYKYQFPTLRVIMVCNRDILFYI